MGESWPLAGTCKAVLQKGNVKQGPRWLPIWCLYNPILDRMREVVHVLAVLG